MFCCELLPSSKLVTSRPLSVGTDLATKLGGLSLYGEPDKISITDEVHNSLKLLLLKAGFMFVLIVFSVHRR